MNSDRKYLLWLFFPITVYMFIGTTLLFVLTKIDDIIELFGNYSKFPGLANYSSNAWYDESIWFTALFPVTWPILLGWLTILLLYAIVAGFIRFFSNLLGNIWDLIFNIVIAIWEWTSDLLKAIWRWIVDALEDIWDQIKSIFR